MYKQSIFFGLIFICCLTIYVSQAYYFKSSNKPSNKLSEVTDIKKIIERPGFGWCAGQSIKLPDGKYIKGRGYWYQDACVFSL